MSQIDDPFPDITCKTGVFLDTRRWQRAGLIVLSIWFGGWSLLVLSGL